MTSDKDPLSLTMNRALRVRAEMQPRKRGRPRKRTDEYLREVLDQHRQVLAWFTARFEHPPRSERELFERWFAHQLEQRGEAPGRVNSCAFTGPINTLRNELSEARTRFGLSRKSPVIREGQAQRRREELPSRDGQLRLVTAWNGQLDE